MLYLAMHIPDGFLSGPVIGVGWVVMVAVMGVALRVTRTQFGERQVPVMGVLTAFIFAAQAINFPVAAGTSGHLCGAALAAVILGPWGAVLVMTSVILVQALLLQDGGLLALSWNVLNMAVVATGAAWAAWSSCLWLLGRLPGGGPRWKRTVAAFVAAWVSVVAAATATALELALSHTSPVGWVVPAMAGVHVFIGVGEGLITCAAVGLLASVRPELAEGGEAAPGRLGASFAAIGLLAALAVGACLPLASQAPDGLERVAADQGFMALAREVEPLLAGWLSSQAGGVAGPLLALALGTLVVFALGLLVGRLAGSRAG